MTSAATKGPLLELRDLTVSIGQLDLVRDVNLSLEAGSTLGLVGESGCGKSTLVRLIARLLDTTEGRIGFDGTDLAAIPAKRFAQAPQRAAIQMVFQDPTDSLNPRFTAREAIREPLLLLAKLKRAHFSTSGDDSLSPRPAAARRPAPSRGG